MRAMSVRGLQPVLRSSEVLPALSALRRLWRRALGRGDMIASDDFKV
jgi:hypothetical protein